MHVTLFTTWIITKRKGEIQEKNKNYRKINKKEGKRKTLNMSKERDS